MASPFHNRTLRLAQASQVDAESEVEGPRVPSLNKESP